MRLHQVCNLQCSAFLRKLFIPFPVEKCTVLNAVVAYSMHNLKTVSYASVLCERSFQSIRATSPPLAPSSPLGMEVRLPPWVGSVVAPPLGCVVPVLDAVAAACAAEASLLAAETSLLTAKSLSLSAESSCCQLVLAPLSIPRHGRTGVQ